MSNELLESKIRSQIDQYLVSIGAHARKAALQAAHRGPRHRWSHDSNSRPPWPRTDPQGRWGGVQGQAPTARKKVAGKPGRRARLSSADVEAVANQVLLYVQGHPGERLEEIGRGMGTETAGLKRPIQALLAAGELRTKGQKRGTRYYPAGRSGGKRAKKA